MGGDGRGLTLAMIEYRSAAGRWVLTATVLGSGMALLDSTVVNVALRVLGQDLDAGLAQLQWVTNGYLLTLASLILLSGALGDRFGRRRIFVIGVVAFTVASVVCAVAQSPNQLILARVVQGVGGALLTPASLAIIQSSFAPRDRARAIGAWAGLGGIAAAIGPFVGGWLVQYASWRWVFLINVPLALVTVVVAVRHVPESHDPESSGRFDLTGAALGVLALAGITFALIEAQTMGAPVVVASAATGVLASVAFILVERVARPAMMPTHLFGSLQFSAANAMTLLVYAALGAITFFVVLQLQVVSGYGPLAAGLSMLPITIVMLLLSPRAGDLVGRIGPRLPMTVGPLVCGAGAAVLSGVGASANYWAEVLPGVAVFALGLTTLVAPLTSTVLAAVPDRHAGIASGINNAVARGGSLLAVAALPAVVGLHGDDYNQPAVFSDGYAQAMWLCAALLVAGGVVSGLLIRNPR